MENTQANRKLIARMTMDTFTPQEMDEALLYELCERYKREPRLFESAVFAHERLASAQADEVSP
jgi:hypothetical protein